MDAQEARNLHQLESLPLLNRCGQHLDEFATYIDSITTSCTNKIPQERNHTINMLNSAGVGVSTTGPFHRFNILLISSSDTACSIVRLSFIATSATRAKNDTTCMWQSIFHGLIKTFANKGPGTLIPSTTAASIEMNIAIIAASLVVMRPCFSYIHYLFVTPTAVEHAGSTDYMTSHSYAVSNYAASNSSKSYSKSAQRTADVELATRSVSQERILANYGEPS